MRCAFVLTHKRLRFCSSLHWMSTSRCILVRLKHPLVSDFVLLLKVVKAQAESNILKEYHDLIQEGKEQFSKELRSLMPEVKLGEKGIKVVANSYQIVASSYKIVAGSYKMVASSCKI